MARKNSKIKQKEKNRVTHDQKDILIAKLFKRIKQDEKSIRKGFEACKIWAENQKDWNKEFEREHKLIDCFANDIKLKHKKIKELEDLNKELTIMFGDKIDEYVKANQGLAKANNELGREEKFPDDYCRAHHQVARCPYLARDPTGYGVCTVYLRMD